MINKLMRSKRELQWGESLSPKAASRGVCETNEMNPPAANYWHILGARVLA
jgi:hypothetical protein